MTLLELTQIVYAAHVAAGEIKTQRRGLPWSGLPIGLRDKWRCATAAAVHHPWAAPDLMRAAWHGGTAPVPWHQLSTADRCRWQMMADIARAWRCEVTP